MNLRQAKSLKIGTVLHYTGPGDCGPKQKGGSTVIRYRVNGVVQTWKRSPERVRVPLKHGLYHFSELTETNLDLFHLESECPLLQASEDHTEDDDSQDPEPDDDYDSSSILLLTSSDEWEAIDLSTGQKLTRDQVVDRFGPETVSEFDQFYPPEDYTEPIPFPVPTEAVERDPSWLASHMDQLMEESIHHESTSPGLPLVPMSFSADQIRYFTTIDIPGAPVSASKFANLNAVYRFETSGLDSVAITIAVPLKEVDHLAMALVRWVTFSSTRIQE